MVSLFSLHDVVKDGKTTQEIGASVWWWGAAILEIVLVIAMSWGSLGKRMSVAGVGILFLAFASLNGVTLAPVLYAYTTASAVKTFFITAGTFGVAALWGHTTKVNLRPFGTFFLFALIGLIIALIVNIFLASPLMDYVVSCVGVALFSALTAYDMQKLQAFYEESSDDEVPSLVVYGALSLYLDFINLYLYLLRFIGVRKD